MSQHRQRSTADFPRRELGGRVHRWRIRYSTWLARAGWSCVALAIGAIFLSGVLGQLQSWGWYTASATVLQALDVLGWAFWIGVAFGLLTLTEPEEEVLEPTTTRLKQVMQKFNELNGLIHEIAQLADDVQELTQRSAELEERTKKREAYLGMTEAQQRAIDERLGLHGNTAKRRELLLFAAGVAAGVVTNLVVK